MNAPLTPNDATERQPLRVFSRLDTDPEPEFDEIATMAAQICDTPIALIAFVDPERAWFRTRIGVSEMDTPRMAAFVHALHSREILVIPDTLADARFASNPHVMGEPRIRFHAGAPMISPDGDALGSLCVIDHTPRQLTRQQCQSLQILSRSALTLLQLRYERRAKQRAELALRNSLRETAKITQSLQSNNERYERRHAALIALTRGEFWNNGGKSAALQEITESVARALEVERVSIWRFTPDRKAIACHDLFEKSATRHSNGQQLQAEAVPSYFRALSEQDIISADDACRDPRTGEFAEFYLNPLGITSMLDAPVRVGGILDGVLCIEHVGEQRSWTHGEQSFAVSVANLVSLLLSQHALARSETRLRTILESEPECVKVVSTDGRCLDINRAGLQMIEAPDLHAVINLPIINVIHPADRPSFIALHQRSSRGENGQLQFRIIGLKGRERWVETHSTPLREADGSIGSVLSVTRDITERKYAEQKMREQAALLEKAQDAIVVRDLDHRVLFWNQSAERIYGWKSDDTLGRPITEMVYRELGAYQKASHATLTDGEWVGEIEQVTRAGRSLTVEGRWTLVRDDAARPQSILEINTDISGRKSLEQQFLRAQRLESIGTLAGGIAHDLNNLLAPIVMGVDLLKQFGHDDQSLQLIRNIERSALRGTDLVKQVLSFARGVEGSRVTVFPAHIVREVEAIALNTFPKNIVFTSDSPHTLWAITGDPTQLNQVLLNLCVNARDAMPNGGRLSIRVRNTSIDESQAGMFPNVLAGRYIRIEVVDTGVGMPPDVIDRIFEPFFTTKEMGKGTGLGLSTVLGIVRSHGGFITVESEVGKGTVFKVHLPVPAENVSQQRGMRGENEPLPRGKGELILLVDDEALVLDVTKQTLEAFGYRVVVAEDGVKATNVYALHRADIALVLTDMMMPFMDGAALIAALQKLDPSVRIIAASGLNTSSDVTEATNAGVKHFLPKPYTAHGMLTLVRTALDER